jgi:hypothetical protein
VNRSALNCLRTSSTRDLTLSFGVFQCIVTGVSHPARHKQCTYMRSHAPFTAARHIVKHRYRVFTVLGRTELLLMPAYRDLKNESWSDEIILPARNPLRDLRLR